MPGIAARTFACAAVLLARSLNFRYDGIAIASRIPMMMMTTRSSMSVKPSFAWSRFRMTCTEFSFLRGYRKTRGDAAGIGDDMNVTNPPSRGIAHPEKAQGAFPRPSLAWMRLGVQE